MDDRYWLGTWCASQPGMFVIPIECVSPDGVAARFREDLVARGLADEAWLDLFEEAFAAYTERTRELARRAPMHWFPPRVQNVCVVTDPSRVRPYFQPFYKASWLVYHSDFDPVRSNVELAVFQLLQAERAGLMQQIAPVLGCNLSYLLTLGADQLSALGDGCERTERPDAAFFRSLGRALPWLSQLHHEILAPPEADPEPTITLQGTGLIVPRARQAEMQSLLATWTRTFQHVADAHYAVHSRRSRDHAQELGAWIRQARPRVLVTGAGGRILWDPREPHATRDLARQVSGISESAEASLRADLETVGRHSQQFLDRVRDPEALPRPDAASADQRGLSYMHLERREIAYNVREESMHRLREPAPAFERLMLGARTVHEWGHLAAEAGWVPIRDVEAFSHAQGELAELLDEIVVAVPERLASLCARSLRLLKGKESTPGPALARLALSRIGDYQSNLVSQRFLSPAERETYVRNNLRSLVHDYPREAFFQRLVRYAYDYQYLRFTSIEDPRAYFLASTWFEEQYLAPGLVSEAHFERLFEGMSRLCELYVVDESRFEPGGPPT